MGWTKLGALWKTKSKAGKTFLRGEIEIDGKKTAISVWPNDKGDNERRPDFVIYDNTRVDAPAQAKKEDKDSKFPWDDNPAPGEKNSDDVPF